ncbi:hypothetical protein D3C86_1764200 [compost metagenome]
MAVKLDHLDDLEVLLLAVLVDQRDEILVLILILFHVSLLGRFSTRRGTRPARDRRWDVSVDRQLLRKPFAGWLSAWPFKARLDYSGSSGWNSSHMRKKSSGRPMPHAGPAGSLARRTLAPRVRSARVRGRGFFSGGSHGECARSVDGTPRHSSQARL